MDAQAALDTVLEFGDPTAVVVKHMNPCGVATGKDSREALETAWFADPISAMGSVLAFNSEFDMRTLRFLRGKEVDHLSFRVEKNKLIPEKIKRKFIEVILAPSFSEEIRVGAFNAQIFGQKKIKTYNQEDWKGYCYPCFIMRCFYSAWKFFVDCAADRQCLQEGG